MFEILLPVDSDEDRALTAAEAILSLPDATRSVQVTILSVQEEVDVTDTEGGKVSSEEWYEETEFPKSAESVKKYLEDEGLAVVMRREHADPAEAIVETATEIGADRIVMSGRKRSAVGKALFGSVTQSVLLQSEIPVTVVMD
ncbi:MAG: universal stress protein [Natronomonas sp.]